MSGETINTCEMPATKLVELYELKIVSPVEAVKEALARIAEIDGDVNAYCLVDGEAALAAAKMSENRWMKSEPQGLADGVHLSVKDIVLTKGHTVRRGSRTTPENEPDRF